MTNAITPMSMLIHGPSKVGKSELLTTAPGPILYADVEGQTRFLTRQADKMDWDMMTAIKPKPHNWVRVRISHYDDILRLYQMLAAGGHPFKSVVIDSVSELQQRYVDRIAGTNQMETQNWGELLRGLAALIRQFRDLLEHPTTPLDFVGMTAMSFEKGGKQSPMLQGKMATMLPYFLDVVGYYTPYVDSANGINVRRLYLDPSPFYDAGSRVHFLKGYRDIAEGDAQAIANMMVRP